MPAKNKMTLPAGWWMWLLNAVLIPAVAMFFFFVQNKQYVSFSVNTLFCGVFVLGTAIGWGIVFLIFRSGVSAFAACAVGWAMLLSYNGIKLLLAQAGVDMNAPVKAALVLLTGLLALAAAWALRKRSGRKAAQPVMIFLAVLFVMNAVSAVGYMVSPSSGTQSQMQVQREAFTLSDNAKKPNVYWFHCDGMLSFDGVQTYFGDDQTWFAGELARRDFQINRSAAFEAVHTTAVAWTALTCPDGYDSFIAPYVSGKNPDEIVTNVHNLEILLDMRKNTELTQAFSQAGYTTRMVNPYVPYIFPMVDVAYTGSTAEQARAAYLDDDIRQQLMAYTIDRAYTDYLSAFSFPLARFVELFQTKQWEVFSLPEACMRHLDQYPPDALIEQVLCGQQDESFDIGEDWDLGAIAAALYDMQSAQPSFTVIVDFLAHAPFLLDENGNFLRTDGQAVMDYLPQHTYSAKVLVNLIDIILDKDPDAVIVLQADHGLHMNSEKEFQVAFGPDARAEDLWNGVISAIRVPETYQTGQEHYALANPLNISRYLVNSFVGPNYTYLP